MASYFTGKKQKTTSQEPVFSGPLHIVLNKSCPQHFKTAILGLCVSYVYLRVVESTSSSTCYAVSTLNTCCSVLPNSRHSNSQKWIVMLSFSSSWPLWFLASLPGASDRTSCCKTVVAGCLSLISCLTAFLAPIPGSAGSSRRKK